ncbi:peptidase S41 [Clostridium tetani]|nr:peptidase S41 [Clostridium tetani]RXM60213.1 peptidase S41 [Clostridium tetani]RXM65094.1 peptidase S41 [Clostridium tetani]
MKMKRFKKITILAVVLIILILSKSFIGKAYYKKNAPEHIKNFSKKEALEDYDYMWNVLERNYPCFNVIERKHGVTIKDIKNGYRKRIENRENVDFKYFNMILNKSINKFSDVGHLYVMDFNFYIMLRGTFDAIGKNEIGGIVKNNFEMAINKKTEETYKHIYNISYGKKILKNLNFTNISNKLYDNKNLSFKEIDKDTAYIKINNFYHYNIANDKDKLINFYRKNSDKKNLVIDLTENRGGADSYWMTSIVAPNIDKELKLYNQYALYKNGDIVNDQWVKKHGNNEYREITKDFSEVLKLSKIRKEDLKDLKYLEISKSIPYNVKPSSKEKLFKGKIYVLVSEQVQSSGEDFVEYCKNTKFATLIGTNTGGNSPAMSPVYDVLPNSGLLLMYQIDYKLNPDGTCNTEFGLPPDIVSKENEEPLDTFKRVILEKKL